MTLKGGVGEAAKAGGQKSREEEKGEGEGGYCGSGSGPNLGSGPKSNPQQLPAPPLLCM